MNSRYFIIEHIKFIDDPADATDDSSYVGRLYLFGRRGDGTPAPTEFGVIRHCELGGNFNNGGIGLNVGLVHDIVIWKNFLHDGGNLYDTGDQDVHGITVGGGGDKQRIWVLENEIARFSGDGMQVNGGTTSLNATNGTAAVTASSTNRIYVGRNYMHHNKQIGFGSKQAQDVIVSENVFSDHKASSSSSGGCAGYQYGPDYIWFIANRMSRCDYGIQGQSDSGLGFLSPKVYVVGNIMNDIHWSDSYTSQAGYMFRSGGPRYIVNNTFYGVDKAIDSQTASTGTMVIANNLIAKVGDVNGTSNRAIVVGRSELASATRLSNNLFAGSFQVTLGGSNYTTVSSLNDGSTRVGNIAGSHGLANPDGGDFHILGGSLGVDAGAAEEVYRTFYGRYGISIELDTDGTPRPYGTRIDIGADEYGSGRTIMPAPAPPSGLRVVPLP